MLVALTEVGAPAKVYGVTGVVAAELGPVPLALVATMVKVYVAPLVSPDTVQVSPVVVHVNDPGEDVAV